MTDSCSRCGHRLLAGANFCPECGAKLSMTCAACGTVLSGGTMFCVKCGVKVGPTSTAGKEKTSIDIAPSALALADCRITIHGVSAEGPDENGCLSVVVKYEVANDTNENWEYLDIRLQLLGASGQVVEETCDAREQTISAGNSAELESTLWGFKARTLGRDLSKTHVIVSLIACGLRTKDLGVLAIPEELYVPGVLKPAKVGDELQLLSGSVWKSELDSDDNVCIEVRMMMQNLTNNDLPLVKVVADVTDNVGRGLIDAGGFDEIRPGRICVIRGSGCIETKELNEAKAALSLRAYPPIAAGVTQISGLNLASPSSRGTNELPLDQPDADEIEDPEPTAGRERKFATSAKGNLDSKMVYGDKAAAQQPVESEPIDATAARALGEALGRSIVREVLAASWDSSGRTSTAAPGGRFGSQPTPANATVNESDAPIEISAYVTISPVLHASATDWERFGEDAYDPFPDTPVFDFFFDDSGNLVVVRNHQTDEFLFGKSAVARSLKSFLEGPCASFAPGGKLNELLSASSGTAGARMYWYGDARDLPDRDRDDFFKLVRSTSTVVVWKQMREVQWKVRTLEELGKLMDQGDFDSYDDLVAVF